MFEFLGAVPDLLVPDNLKSAIKKACRYEPEATSTYEDMARHYGTAILPARPYRARDKAAVEMSVLVVQRWILARLRNRQFFSLAELNIAIAELLVDLNNRPFKKLPGCRAQCVRSHRPAGHEAAAAQRATNTPNGARRSVDIDYHVEVERPLLQRAARAGGPEYRCARCTATTIECFFKGRRVAAHVRSYLRGKHTTLA